MAEQCNVKKQLIDGDGKFDDAGLDHFAKAVKLPECGVSYAVVAIMGPQSSGKSTLLNNLFCTDFTMMDAREGSNQTTKGIWMATAPNIQPLTLIMDIEGNDGKERGEDVAFEKQSALFALALADVVLINMWHKDIGRQNGANKPLLTTVFQAMIKLFLPRKTKLLFVIRDTDMRTPFEKIESALKDIIQEIWENIPKSVDRQNAALEDFFSVEVITLCHFDYQQEEFNAQVGKLRKRFTNSIAPGGLAGDSQERVPGSGFSLSAQNLWEVIKGNKDLNLPAHKVMIATIRCEEIAKEKFRLFCEDKDLSELKVAAQSGSVPDFGKKLSSILNIHLLEYDKEAMHFDEGVRDDKRNELESKMVEHVHPTFETLLSYLRSQANERFHTELEKALSKEEAFIASVRNCKEACLLEFETQCKDIVVPQAANWDVTKVRNGLVCDLEAHSSSLLSKKLSEIVACCKRDLFDSIKEDQIRTLLREAADYGDSWATIREIVESGTNTAVSNFLSRVSGFELDESACEEKKGSIIEYARSVVVGLAREEAQKVVPYMKERFTRAFNDDQDFITKNWTSEVDISEIVREARSTTLKILAVMAVIRLEERPDNVESILHSSLMNQPSSDPLDSTVWPEVSPADTLITPLECKSRWKQFKKETKHIIMQVEKVQEANIARDEAKEAARIAKERADATATARAEDDATLKKRLEALEEATKRAEDDATLKKRLEAHEEATKRAEAARADAEAELRRSEIARAVSNPLFYAIDNIFRPRR